LGLLPLKKLADTFKNNDLVRFLAVQTVVEGYRDNTRDKLRENQLIAQQNEDNRSVVS
jgi:hypothetical protein